MKVLDKPAEEETHCTYCERVLNSTNAKEMENDWVCLRCKVFTFKGRTKHNDLEKAKKKMKKIKVTKKRTKEETQMDEQVKKGGQKTQILSLLNEGKTVDEVVSTTGFKRAHVNNIKKKFFDKTE